jgi:putative methyltransferase (TIGR04325 family)
MSMSTTVRRVKGKLLRTPVLNTALRLMAATFASQRFLRAGHAFRGVYPTFDAARLALPQGRAQGYDNSAAASYYRDRLERVYPGDYPVLFWLSRCLPLTRVFDLGGHVGIAFRAYRRYLPVESTAEWLVCDVPAVCDAGRELAKEWQTPNLNFTSDRVAGSGSELFFASGSLQYLEVGLSDVLSSYSARPRHVLLNLLPVSELPTYYTTQTIGVAFCPYRIQSGPDLLADMASLGYELVDRWKNVEKRCWIPLYPEHSLEHYEGFYFRLT